MSRKVRCPLVRPSRTGHRTMGSARSVRRSLKSSCITSLRSGAGTTLCGSTTRFVGCCVCSVGRELKRDFALCLFCFQKRAIMPPATHSSQEFRLTASWGPRERQTTLTTIHASRDAENFAYCCFLAQKRNKMNEKTKNRKETAKKK